MRRLPCHSPKPAGYESEDAQGIREVWNERYAPEAHCPFSLEWKANAAAVLKNARACKDNAVWNLACAMLRAIAPDYAENIIQAARMEVSPRADGPGYATMGEYCEAHERARRQSLGGV
jgi:hypothetical protein